MSLYFRLLVVSVVSPSFFFINRRNYGLLVYNLYQCSKTAFSIFSSKISLLLNRLELKFSFFKQTIRLRATCSLCWCRSWRGEWSSRTAVGFVAFTTASAPPPRLSVVEGKCLVVVGLIALVRSLPLRFFVSISSVKFLLDSFWVLRVSGLGCGCVLVIVLWLETLWMFLPSPLRFSWVCESGSVKLWDHGFTAEGFSFPPLPWRLNPPGVLLLRSSPLRLRPVSS